LRAKVPTTFTPGAAPERLDRVLHRMRKERSGMTSGINDTFRQVGIAVGVTAWGAILLARVSDKVATLAAGTPADHAGEPRQLVEAFSGGHLASALGTLPHVASETLISATREGFLTGLNTILMLGG
jgi:hypothetical protein